MRENREKHLELLYHPLYMRVDTTSSSIFTPSYYLVIQQNIFSADVLEGKALIRVALFYSTGMTM